MSEFTLTLDAVTGTVLVQEHEDLPQRLHESLTDLLGPATEIGCARPSMLLPPPEATGQDQLGVPCLRVSGYYHNSLIEGPGRRSSLLVSGCDLGCRGCWVPFLHPTLDGALVPIHHLADALLDPTYERDGISILGGEPMQQSHGLLALVRALRAKGCSHILVYSGYTYERLRRMAERQSAIGAILDDIDALVDGPYVEALAQQAGPWTGSSNQRVIDTAATRTAGRVVLREDISPDQHARKYPQPREGTSSPHE